MTLFAQPNVYVGGDTLFFTVYGEAKPGGSKKALQHPRTGRIMVIEDSRNKPWRQQVAHTGLAARVDAPWGDRQADFPLVVEFTFYRPRPKSHYGSGRNAGIVKPGASAAPGTRPDVLKLARACEDALTKILWVDDALICDERLRKVWGEPERVEISVRPL